MINLQALACKRTAVQCSSSSSKLAIATTLSQGCHFRIKFNTVNTQNRHSPSPAKVRALCLTILLPTLIVTVSSRALVYFERKKSNSEWQAEWHPRSCSFAFQAKISNNKHSQKIFFQNVVFPDSNLHHERPIRCCSRGNTRASSVVFPGRIHVGRRVLISSCQTVAIKCRSV